MLTLQSSFSPILDIGRPISLKVPRYPVLNCPILIEIPRYPKIGHPLWTFPNMNFSRSKKGVIFNNEFCGG